MEFTILVEPPSATPITYSWATSVENDDNATADSDFTTSSQSDVVIAADAASDTISVPILGDVEAEEDETFTVTLTLPQTATNITLVTASAKGKITNDDGSLLTIQAASLVEGPANETGTMSFTVMAFPTPTTELSATWTTSVEADDSATADTDFTSGTGMVTIAANSTSGTFEVDIIGDGDIEDHETFTVALSSGVVLEQKLPLNLVLRKVPLLMMMAPDCVLKRQVFWKVLMV